MFHPLQESIQNTVDRISQLGKQSASADARALLDEALQDLSSLLAELQAASAEQNAQSGGRGGTRSTRGALEGELERYRGLFAEAPVPYLVTTPNGAIRNANVAAGDLLQWQYDSLIGKPLPALIPLEVRDTFRALLLELDTNDDTDRATTILLRRDGTHVPSTLFVQKAFDPVTQGRELRWVIRPRTADHADNGGSPRIDVGLPDEIVLALQGAATVDDVLDGVLRLIVPPVADFAMIDLAGPRGMRIRCAASHADPARRALVADFLAAAAVVDVTLAPAVTNPVPKPVTEIELARLCATEAERAALEALGLVSCVTASMCIEHHVIGAITFGWSDDGPSLPLDVETLQRTAGRVALLLHQVIDREAARSAADGAARALMTLAHDLRAPLGAIAQQLDVIATDPVSATAARPLHSIRQAAAHMSDMLADVVTTGLGAGADDGAGGGAVERLDAGAVVREVTLLLSPAAATSGVVLTVFTPELPLFVTADRSRLRRTLINLLDDCIAHTTHGEILLTVSGDESGVTFEIAGRGLDLGRLPDVEVSFDGPAPAVTTDMRIGIARHLASSLGGVLTASAPSSAASAFTLWLPVHPAPL